MEAHHQHEGMSMSNGSNVFCQSMESMPGMTMYMSGFHFSLWNTNRDTPLPCLNLISAQWKLDTKPKFLFAMVCVMGLGITMECLMVMKLRYIARLEKKRSHINGQQNRDQVRLFLTCFHGIQALLGYILMLVAMSYSVELLLSAVMGLSIGFALCYKKKIILTSSGGGGGRRGSDVGGGGENSGREGDVEGSSSQSVLTSSIPCCDFLQDMVEQDNSSSFNYSSLPVVDNSNGDDDLDPTTTSLTSTNSNVLHQRPTG